MLVGRPRKNGATCPRRLNDGEQRGALPLNGKRWRHGAAPVSGAKVLGAQHVR